MATRVALLGLIGLVLFSPPAPFTDWSAPVAIGAPVNSTGPEGAPFESKDGLAFYFSALGPDGSSDVFVAGRASLAALWGTPRSLFTINSPATENNPALSLDEHRLYFTTNAPGGFGAQDLWVSRRHDRRDDLGWEPPVNVGSIINTAANEIAPTFFEDAATGLVTMFFASDRVSATSFDIYSSTLLPDGTFTPPVLVSELNSAAADQGPHVRRDGLEIFFASNRPGTLGNTDLMVATRARTSDPWSTPVFLAAPINTAFADQAPALSFDESTLYYTSTANLPGAAGPCTGPLGPCPSDNFLVTRGPRRGNRK